MKYNDCAPYKIIIFDNLVIKYDNYLGGYTRLTGNSIFVY